MLIDYLSLVNQEQKYLYAPIVNRDAWERYHKGAPRSLKISIAAPSDLQNIPGIAGGVLSSSKKLADIVEAPVITVEMTMGQRRGSLAKRAVDQVLSALSSSESDVDVRKLTVKTKEDGEPSDEIDFIKDLARDQDILDLPADDHDLHLNRRLAFIESSFKRRLNELRQLYA